MRNYRVVEGRRIAFCVRASGNARAASTAECRLSATRGCERLVYSNREVLRPTVAEAFSAPVVVRLKWRKSACATGDLRVKRLSYRFPLDFSY